MKRATSERRGHPGTAALSWARVERGLSAASHHIGTFIEGMLVSLAAIVVLEWSADAGTATFALLGSAFALFAGKVYGDIVQQEVEGRHRLRGGELAAVVREALPILLGALPALGVFLLAWPASSKRATPSPSLFGADSC